MFNLDSFACVSQVWFPPETTHIKYKADIYADLNISGVLERGVICVLCLQS